MLLVLEISESRLGVKTAAESRVVMFVFEHALQVSEARIQKEHVPLYSERFCSDMYCFLVAHIYFPFLLELFIFGMGSYLSSLLCTHNETVH